jgi:hypothetical protein
MSCKAASDLPSAPVRGIPIEKRLKCGETRRDPLLQSDTRNPKIAA